MSEPKAEPMPRAWSLLDMLEAVKAKSPKADTAHILELRRRARNREVPKLPDLDSLKAALGRLVEAIQGKPLDHQTVIVGKFRDGSPRYGLKQYYASVPVRDVIAVGLFLEEKNAHDDRTKIAYQGALNAKWGPDNGEPRYIQQLAREVFHLLQVAATAGA